MFQNVKSDPLDVLLFTVGLRLSYLAKSGDAKFKSLLENRNFSIQLGSEKEQIFRTYSVNNGYFTQTPDKIEEPTLTITFKDSMTGVKLLTKADAAAFMVGIQNGDLKMSGDYSWLMWFNQVAKFIVPKMPEKLQPVVEQAKPLLEKATPFAQELIAKASHFFGEKSDKKSDETSKSKFFNEENTPTVVDDLKEKAVELKEKVEEKFHDIKTSAEEKLDELKSQAENKLEEGKEKLDDIKTSAEEKVDELKSQAENKLEQGKEKLDDIKTSAEEKVDELKSQAENKLEEGKEKLDDIKTSAEEKVDELKSQAENKLEQGKEKLDDIKTSAEEKVDEFNLDNLTPAQEKSQVLEAKHTDDEIIAQNIKTEAVKSDESPITNITVTRNI